jgi:hypothetical protein
MFSVELEGHLAVSEDSILCFISRFDLGQQFLVELLIIAFFSVEPFIVGRTLDTDSFTEFTDGIGFCLMEIPYSQIDRFISNLA